jgi:hypothetical protein
MGTLKETLHLTIIKSSQLINIFIRIKLRFEIER